MIMLKANFSGLLKRCMSVPYPLQNTPTFLCAAATSSQRERAQKPYFSL